MSRPRGGSRRRPPSCSAHRVTWTRPWPRSPAGPACRCRPCIFATARRRRSFRRRSTWPSPVIPNPSPSKIAPRTSSYTRWPSPTPHGRSPSGPTGHEASADRTHRLYDVIRSAAADPEVAQVLDKNRNDRSTGHRMLADAIASKRGYDPAVPPSRTADLLYALGTEDAYLLFVVDRGATPTSGSAGWWTRSAPRSCCPVPQVRCNSALRAPSPIAAEQRGQSRASSRLLTIC